MVSQSQLERHNRRKHAALVLSMCVLTLLTLLLVNPGCALPTHVPATPSVTRQPHVEASTEHRTVPPPVSAASLPQLTQLTPLPPIDGEAASSVQVSRTLDLVTYVEPADNDPPLADDAVEEPETLVPAAPGPIDKGDGASGDVFPIDLPTALRLAGANNLQIALASERIEEAYADAAAAKAMWIPSLRAGVGYNTHTGRIQETRGNVIEVRRSSLFVGAGAGLGGAPLNAGAGGPARMFVDLSVADVLFEALAKRQIVDAVVADEGAVFNDTLYQVAIAYLQLLHAEARVAILSDMLAHSESLVKWTGDFARAGEGNYADARRATVDLQRRQRALQQSREAVSVASTGLVRLLRMDPSMLVTTADTAVVPVHIIDSDESLDTLIAQAIAARPELQREAAYVDETYSRVRQEHWRPWLPHLYAGMSGGGFGGSPGGDIRSFNDRSDVDIAAMWELENLGLGNAARRRQQASRHRQAHLVAEQTENRITADVARAYHRVQSRRAEIELLATQVDDAEDALRMNFVGIRGAVLRAIEAQQAITALSEARTAYLDAVLSYNAAQFELLRAIGLPPFAAEDAE